MRKTLIVFLALALVCACGAAVCTHAVAAPREDVTFDEHVFAGDPAAAAGLQVQLQAALQRNLFWDSTVRFSGFFRCESSSFTRFTLRTAVWPP